MSNFPSDLRALRRQMDLTQSEMAARLGLSHSYIHQLEAGKRTPSDSVVVLFNVLRERVEAGLDDVPPGSLQEPLGAYGGKANRARMIPVVSWAHAGRAETYEELPSDWREQIPTECRDEAAFAVSLEGDSMEPVFRSGDLLVVMPSEEVYSGAYAVCRFRDDGVVLRQVEFSGGEVQLVPLNPRFEVRTFPKEQFAWIYPVWGRWSQFWKR